jgi:uncharacterized protein YaaW (UPF0174 family)
MKHPNDTDLDFLKHCTKEELEFLVRLIIDAGGKTNQLEDTAAFKLYHPDHTKYVDEIIEEYQKYAANTGVTLFRGYGVPYREALCDTLDNLTVGYDKELSLAELEGLLLGFGVERYLKILKRDVDRENFQKLLDGLENSLNVGVMPSGSAGVNAAGVAGAALLSVAIAAASGVAALGCGILLLTPAKRVVIPATIYIAKLRKRVNSRIG